jgi:hypothetical protein
VKPTTAEVASDVSSGVKHMSGGAAVANHGSAGVVGLQLLQEGEIVQLLLKPSRWFILLQSIRFAAVTASLVLAAVFFDRHLPGDKVTFIQTGLFLYAGRLMVCVLQWMGRLYVLTNLRVARISGVLTPELAECPLRRIGEVRVTHSPGERLFRLGTIHIACSEPARTCDWQSVADPLTIRDIVSEAARRAQAGGCP